MKDLKIYAAFFLLFALYSCGLFKLDKYLRDKYEEERRIEQLEAKKFIGDSIVAALKGDLI